MCILAILLMISDIKVIIVSILYTANFAAHKKYIKNAYFSHEKNMRFSRKSYAHEKCMNTYVYIMHKIYAFFVRMNKRAFFMHTIYAFFIHNLYILYELYAHVKYIQ